MVLLRFPPLSTSVQTILKLLVGEIEEYSSLYGPAFVGLSLSAVAAFVIVVVLLYISCLLQ